MEFEIQRLVDEHEFINNLMRIKQFPIEITLDDIIICYAKENLNRSLDSTILKCPWCLTSPLYPKVKVTRSFTIFGYK